MNVLSLVTNRYSTFYQKQSIILKNNGIDITHIYPKKQSENHEKRQQISRTYSDYAPLIYKSVPEIFSKYDVVHANNGITAPFGLLHAHQPLVLTLWGSDLMGSYSSLVKRSAKYYDEVIVRSQEMKNELGIDAHIIPSGVDLECFKPICQERARMEVGWGSDQKHILFPYRPEQKIKNYPLAKSVVNQVSKELTSSAELQVITGVPHNRMPLYLNAADALLLTSKREGSPNTVKEAMACNTPVVSTDVGDVQERLEGVTQSTVCQTQSELVDELKLILSRGKRSNGRKYVKDVSLERMGERILDVYAKALDQTY